MQMLWSYLKHPATEIITWYFQLLLESMLYMNTSEEFSGRVWYINGAAWNDALDQAQQTFPVKSQLANI